MFVWRSVVLQIVGRSCIKAVGKGLQQKTIKLLVFFLWLLNSLKILYNSLADHIQKFGLFCDFQYSFSSSWSTADLQAVVSDKFVRDFNRSGTTRAVVLDISKVFYSVWHTCHLHKLKSYQISGRVTPLFCLFSSN